MVTVPVLSSTTVSMRRVDSSTSGPRITTPNWAARPVPTSSAVGVAKPKAQGQAITSTATAAVIAAWALWPVASQPRKVKAARAKTVGTNTELTRSARRCTGAFAAWAAVTTWAIRDNVVPAPTRVARTTNVPEVFTVAPVTSSPALTSTGKDSPVSKEASMAL